eukprot:gene33988-45538_t
MIRWSSTITTNVLAERRGAKVGLVTTKGYRQTLQIARSFAPGGLGGRARGGGGITCRGRSLLGRMLAHGEKLSFHTPARGMAEFDTGPDDIRDEIRIPTTIPDETLAAIEAVLARWHGYDALGIASFGPVSIDVAAADYGAITATTKPGWSHIDVARRLAAFAGVPTGFNSDVAGAALGEGRWGAARDVADHAYVTVGTGVGVGLVLGGKPTNGLTHPELGHVRTVRLRGDDWPGSCSFHGDCVEGLASGTAIRARAGRGGDELAIDDPLWDGVAHTLAQLCHMLVLTGI